MKTASILAAIGLLMLPMAAWADCQVSEILELPVVMQGLRPTVPVKVNGAAARVVLDSGDYESWMTASSAVRLGLRSTLNASDYRAQSAGDSPMTSARTFTMGGIVFKDVPFKILNTRTANGIDGFIGQKLLKVADVDYDLHGGMVRLMRPSDCGDQPLAYWLTAGESFGVAELTASGIYGTQATSTATINGVAVQVGFSTGDSVTIMSLTAAKRAGIKVTDPGVVEAGTITWNGKTAPVWIAPVKSFEFAGEVVRDTRLRITAAEDAGDDLVLGTDFFLSHHLYFANSQHKLYVTYAGGPVFSAYNGGPTPGGH